MTNRITRTATLLMTVVCVATFVLLSRHHPPGEAMAQSQEMFQKWEYLYMSSPFTYGSNGNISTKVFLSQGGVKWLEDSDSTGVLTLNKLGDIGWELVSASDELPAPGISPVPQPTTTRFILKRRRR